MAVPPPTLAELAARVGGEVRGDGSVRIEDLTHDSRGAGPTTAFACRPGLRADGHAFGPEAVAAGAPALVAERPLDVEVPQLLVASVGEALGDLAAAVHGDPSDQLRVLGITGTNGKTTTAFLLEAALTAGGDAAGLIGTVETRVRGAAVPGVRTTPESTDLQRLLRRMADDGVDGVAMEVSSHGLALGRTRGTRFIATAFTNLSQDHLDFHADLEEYFAAKAMLFTPDYTPVGVVCVDDAHGRRLASQAPVEVVRVATTGGVGARAAQHVPDVTASDVVRSPDGARFTAHLRGGSRQVRIGLPGAFNVTNALVALALAETAGVALDDAVTGVFSVDGVPGRMERVQAGQPFTVLVDYAHTPESVEGLLAAVRDLAQGRVIGVLGCGGDRDRAKRPLMGEALAAGADLAVLTSDNPRSEDPDAILDSMVEGARKVPGATWERIPDRREAIGHALAVAEAGDVVVIAGKGHETGQEVAGVTHPFDDRAVARWALGRPAPTDLTQEPERG